MDDNPTNIEIRRKSLNKFTCKVVSLVVMLIGMAGFCGFQISLDIEIFKHNRDDWYHGNEWTPLAYIFNLIFVTGISVIFIRWVYLHPKSLSIYSICVYVRIYFPYIFIHIRCWLH